MASLTTTINVNVPSEVKEEASELFETLGLNMTTAINMFLRKSIEEWAIPFTVSAKKPNKELYEAIQEGNQIIKDIESGKRKGYQDIDKMFKDILNEKD